MVAMSYILKKQTLIEMLFIGHQKILVLLLSGLCPLIAWSKSTSPTHLPSTPLVIQSQKATTPSLYDRYPWSLLYYYGVTVNNPLIDLLTLPHLKRWPEHIQSLELAYTLSQENAVRRFFNPLVGVVQITGNFTKRNGSNEHTIYEFDPSILFRWANFPWNNTINTSFALAEGISYDTSIPFIEKKDNSNTKHLLNFMVVEVTVAYPHYPRLQLVGRIHHRSGAYGLYHAGNTGSNDLSLGVRYLFD